MLNMCVKNVNNQRINNCKTGGYISTHLNKSLVKLPLSWLQIVFVDLAEHIYSTTLSTYKNRILYLLNKSFTINPQHLLLDPINEI